MPNVKIQMPKRNTKPNAFLCGKLSLFPLCCSVLSMVNAFAFAFAFRFLPDSFLSAFAPLRETLFASSVYSVPSVVYAFDSAFMSFPFSFF